MSNSNHGDSVEAFLLELLSLAEQLDESERSDADSHLPIWSLPTETSETNDATDTKETIADQDKDKEVDSPDKALGWGGIQKEESETASWGDGWGDGT